MLLCSVFRFYFFWERRTALFSVCYIWFRCACILQTIILHRAQKRDFLDHNNVIVVIYGLYSIFCNFTNLVKDEQQTFTQSEFQLAYLTKLLSTFWKHKNIIICWEICPRQQKAIYHLFTHCICDCFICLNDKKGPTVTIILIYMDG